MEISVPVFQGRETEACRDEAIHQEPENTGTWIQTLLLLTLNMVSLYYHTRPLNDMEMVCSSNTPVPCATVMDPNITLYQPKVIILP